MKKVTVSALMLSLCCVPALCQEETSGNVPEVSVVARLDTNPVVPLGDYGGYEFDAAEFFGNSSLYTLIDGNIGDHFAYSVANHWLSTDPRFLYVRDFDEGPSKANFFFSDDVNWLDWANVSFLADGDWGGFEFRVGKDVTAIGSMEIDDYDFDCHYPFTSYFWNSYNVYQWGATAAYTLPDGTNTLAFQFQTSPFGDRSFASKLFNYSLQWRAEYDWATFIYATNFLQYDVNSYMNVIGLGNEFYMGDFTLRLDWMNRATTVSDFFGQEGQVNGALTYDGGSFDIGLKGACYYFPGGYDFMYDCETENCFWMAGLLANWYPIEDSRDLRVHALVGYNTMYNNDYHDGDSCLNISLGVTYNLNLTSLFKR
ncbi:MAG: hypothetical protein MJY56_04760 [Bacteroidales bacterium]|nr:hypothetical protein [Bacteroidales bacterium]